MAKAFGPAKVAAPITGCFALLVAGVFLVLSFASAHWSEDKQRIRHGLWRTMRCQGEACWQADHMHYMYSEGWLKAVQAMESLAIIFMVLPLITIPVYLYVSFGLYYRTTMAIATVCCGLCAVFTFIGVIIYGVKIAQRDWDLKWCFVICIVGGIIAIAAFIIFLVTTMKGRPEFYKDPVARMYDQSSMHSQVYTVDTQSNYPQDTWIRNG